MATRNRSVEKVVRFAVVLKEDKTLSSSLLLSALQKKQQ